MNKHLIVFIWVLIKVCRYTAAELETEFKAEIQELKRGIK